MIADQLGYAVMVYRNASTPAGGACDIAPPPVDDAVPIVATPTPTPTPPAEVPRTCQQPGTKAFTVGTSGRDVLVGTAGRDVLSGRGGDDCLYGLSGDDTITPGSGKDKVNAGRGNDTISARDQTRDAIDCGAGRDKVTADRTDTVKSNCERVKRATRRG